MNWLGLRLRRRPGLPDAAPGALQGGRRPDARGGHGLPLLLHARRPRQDEGRPGSARREAALRRHVASAARQDAAGDSRRREAGGALRESGRRRGHAGTTSSRARSRSATRRSTTSSSCATTACRRTTSRWWSTTGTCASATSSAATSTSTTRPGRSTCSARWAPPLPQFGHLPIILGDDGLKLSKRRGAVSVTDYEDDGYLPEGMNNYLARLGWSHGDDELFTLRADGGVVRRLAPEQEPGAVGSGQAAVGQRAPHEAGRRRAPGDAGGGAAGEAAASPPRPTPRWPRAARC